MLVRVRCPGRPSVIKPEPLSPCEIPMRKPAQHSFAFSTRTQLPEQRPSWKIECCPPPRLRGPTMTGSQLTNVRERRGAEARGHSCRGPRALSVRGSRRRRRGRGWMLGCALPLPAGDPSHSRCGGPGDAKRCDYLGSHLSQKQAFSSSCLPLATATLESLPCSPRSGTPTSRVYPVPRLL